MNHTLPTETSQEVTNVELNGHKFIRRPDLSVIDRLHIAQTALMAQEYNYWGVITELSEQYMISRTFVYMLANTLRETSSILFGDKELEQVYINNKESTCSYMLALRMEGQCSIGATST
ncbi:MAG: hypothetical protein GY834_11570, partial [Bacteroidetes bacterium]|nr:hypothetical protein [Bacteroidota bacterium]